MSDQQPDNKRVIDPSLGEQLRAIREEAGFTQSQLAEILGVNRTQVSRIEKGTRSTGYATVRKWYQACGYELDAIQVGTPDQSLRVAEALAELPNEYLDDVIEIIIAWPKAPDRTRGRILGLLEAIPRASTPDLPNPHK